MVLPILGANREPNYHTPCIYIMETTDLSRCDRPMISPAQHGGNNPTI
ncbi:MAG: hypothetical protein RMZ41_004550 [Nostoc sp. DedVER02]|nr:MULTISPECIES: hypothetical protein [unclassified Nostoc]MDZ7989935.1 hypothetical protein [Nostoc sp. DedVER02]MDZ8112003.1 hypothetical protein [Nostoc sp. DedVER01b]